jgi:hypothetical protein
VGATSLMRAGRVFDSNTPAVEGRRFRPYPATSAHRLKRRAANAGPEGLGPSSVNGTLSGSTRPRRWAPTWQGLEDLNWPHIGARACNGPLRGRPGRGPGHQLAGCRESAAGRHPGCAGRVAATRGVAHLAPGQVIIPNPLCLAVLAEAGVNQFLSSFPLPPGEPTGARVAPMAVIEEDPHARAL